MDRVTQYAGALVASKDGLTTQQNTMVALAYTAQAFLGTPTAVDGFGLAPTTPASLVANLSPGAVYQLENLEATAWSSLPANTASSILKQGLMQVVDPITFTPPATTGYSQAFLVEVQYADLDTNPVLLPYYNATMPSQPYSGPGGSGSSQNTARLGIVAVQVKAGVAVNGTPAVPTPDAGWSGLYVVTLAAGATTVTAGNIATYAGAPFIPVKLPGVPLGVQAGQWVAFVAGGSATAYTGTLNPIPTSLTPRMEVLGAFATANTGTSPTLNLNGLGALPILKQGGGAPAVGDISGFVPLILNSAGSAWIINGLVASDASTAYVLGTDTGAAGSIIVAAPIPSVTALRVGLTLVTVPASVNAGPTTINLAGLGAKPVIYPNGSPFLGGETQPRPQVFIYDQNGNWEWQGQQSPVLQQATTFYVNAASGSDSNNGLTAAAAFATGQKAANAVSALNANGQNVAIQFAAGTYTNIVFSSAINGNLTLNAPSGVTFNGTVNAAILANYGAQLTVNGGTITTGASNCDGLYSLNGANINYQNVTFGACSRYHTHADGGKVQCTGSYTISGGALAHAYAQSSGGYIILTPSYAVTVTLSGTPSISQFVVANDLGFIRANSTNTTYSGSATGTRYYAVANGVIETQGSGANFFPGNSAGATATGGEYI